MKTSIITTNRITLNCIFALILFFLMMGFVISGCGKKGPPEMIEKAQKNLKPVYNLSYEIQDNNILLKWESNYKKTIEGFEIFMAKQNIQKCQRCPVVFIKIDFLSSDLNQYKKELKQGYRYFFKILTLGENNMKSLDSETIKIELK